LISVPLRWSRLSIARAHTNSTASTLSPKKINSQPGPGVTSITMPSAITVNPTTAMIARLAWRNVSKNIRCTYSENHEDGRNTSWGATNQVGNASIEMVS
jgi:hypothetical protein